MSAPSEATLEEIQQIIEGQGNAKPEDDGAVDDDNTEADSNALDDSAAGEEGGAKDEQKNQDALSDDGIKDGSQEADADSEGAGDEEQPVTLKDVAEQLGVSAKDLYNELMIPMSPGEEPITLGEFKDRIKDLQEVDRLMSETLERESTFHKEQAASRKEMTELLTVLPPQAYTPELLQAAQRVHRETAIREGQALLERIPAWQDGNVKTAEQSKIKTLMAEYGYRSYEVDQILDHRVWGILNEFQQLKEHVKLNDPESFRERAGIKRTQRKRPGKGASLREKLNKAKAPNATATDVDSAVDALIGGPRVNPGSERPV